MGRTKLAIALRIASYLRRHRKRFEREGLTLSDVAAEVSALIGRPYGPTAVCRLRKQLRMSWGKRYGRKEERDGHDS